MEWNIVENMQLSIINLLVEVTGSITWQLTPNIKASKVCLGCYQLLANGGFNLWIDINLKKD